MINNKIKVHIRPLIWALIILILTLSPGNYIPKIDYWSILSLDKYVHCGIFFLLNFLLLWDYKKHYKPRLATEIIITSISIVYGIWIEIIQQYIPLRSFEWNDMLANASGAWLAWVVFRVVFRRKRG